MKVKGQGHRDLTIPYNSNKRFCHVCSPALPVPAGSGKLSGEEGALAAPQTPHGGGGGQSRTPGCHFPLDLFHQRRGGTSHDAAGSGGEALKEQETETEVSIHSHSEALMLRLVLFFLWIRTISFVFCKN